MKENIPYTNLIAFMFLKKIFMIQQRHNELWYLLLGKELYDNGILFMKPDLFFTFIFSSEYYIGVSHVQAIFASSIVAPVNKIVTCETS